MLKNREFMEVKMIKCRKKYFFFTDFNELDKEIKRLTQLYGYATYKNINMSACKDGVLGCSTVIYYDF